MAGHFTWILALLWPVLPLSLPAGETLSIDGHSSQVTFSVRLLWLHRIEGHSGRMHGDITLDDPTHATVDTWIDVNSARMSRARYTRWLLSPTFFDADRYPRIHFVSAPTSLTALREGGILRGRLTMRGVSRTVAFTVHPSRCLQEDVTHCTLRVDGTLRRSDFDMRKRRALISDDVHLDIRIHLRRETGPSNGRQPVSSRSHEVTPHPSSLQPAADRHDRPAPGLRPQSSGSPPGHAGDAPRAAGGRHLRAR